MVERGASHARSFDALADLYEEVRPAELLSAGGLLAIFGNSADISAEPSYAAIQRAYAEHASALVGQTPAHEWYASPSSPILGELTEHARFGAPQHEAFYFEQTLSARQYCQLLRTHSSHSTLPAAQLSVLLDAITHAIEGEGGRIGVRYCTGLYLARAA